LSYPSTTRDPLEVEWAGHPNWYFRISKFSLPFLHHPSVPKAVFLDDWFAHRNPKAFPINAKGSSSSRSTPSRGREFSSPPPMPTSAPSRQADRHLYLLQERVTFEPVIQTPHGPTQAEIRIMYLWPDGGALQPAISLVRLGRGLMMGVDHNRDQEWVGSSAALTPSL
jgi:hypothetical protein